ncbi:phosphoribosylglycinamide formyltransferase [Ferrovibrio xuzhouensis]|uniref:Phosphoribosylglycinamide formyltransferase n=1 Tax=Ferrovibrio xuzhouensis TaxID=1576914 RepID=A0ABV7VIV7_9PROT
MTDSGAGRKAVAILISGRGSNMAALIDAACAPDYPARIALVLSNRADAEGLAEAQAKGIATAVIESKGKDRAAFDAELDALLNASGIDIVCLAGFMRLLTPQFVQGWSGRMINIHPSLLPAFKGLDVHRRVVEAGAKITGCTVHFVVPEMDDGPVIAQAAVPVPDGATADDVAAAVLAQEHVIYPQALRWLAEERLAVSGNTVTVRDAELAKSALLSPLP